MTISRSVKTTRHIAKAIAHHGRPGDIICLFGGLGAGKTVMAQGVAEGLGLDRSSVISPTFVLLRQYPQGRIPLYHFDLYRLKDDADILALGYEEYLYGEGLTVIEWADRLKYLLPKEYLAVELIVKGKTCRGIRFTARGSRYRQLLQKIYAHLRH